MKLHTITGHVVEKKGRLYLTINTYVDGVRKPTSMPTGLVAEGNRENAEKLLKDTLAKYEAVVVSEKKRQKQGILVADYLHSWLEDKKPSIELSTWENYQVCVESHLAPYFKEKNLTLQELSRRYIKEYYNYKARTGRKDGKPGGLSTDTIKKHASVLKMTLDEAVIMELISYNPALNVPITRTKSDEVERYYLSWAEAKKLLQLMHGHMLYPIVYTALYWGLRRSEILGLRWNAINFHQNTIKINNTIVKVKTVMEKPRTKTKASKVTYELQPIMKQILLEHRKQVEQNKLKHQDSYFESNYVFVQENGKPYHPDSLKRLFEKFLKKNDLPSMGLHDLRYSTASILHEMGWSQKDIQVWMRHSDSYMTSYYTHITERHRNIISERADAIFTFNDLKDIGCKG